MTCVTKTVSRINVAMLIYWTTNTCPYHSGTYTMVASFRFYFVRTHMFSDAQKDNHIYFNSALYWYFHFKSPTEHLSLNLSFSLKLCYLSCFCMSILKRGYRQSAEVCVYGAFDLWTRKELHPPVLLILILAEAESVACIQIVCLVNAKKQWPT